MTCRNLAAIVVLAACGCSPTGSPDGAPTGAAPAPEVDITVPDSSTAGGQTPQAEANSKLTLVSLDVPGMT